MNTFAIFCPGDDCGRSFDVPLGYAGKKGRCPHCRSIFTIPHPGTRTARLPQEARESLPLELLADTPYDEPLGGIAVPAGDAGFGGIDDDIFSGAAPASSLRPMGRRAASGLSVSIWLGILLGAIVAGAVWIGVMKDRDGGPKPEETPSEAPLILNSYAAYRELLEKHTATDDTTRVPGLNPNILGRRFTMTFEPAQAGRTDGRAERVYTMGGLNLDTQVSTVYLCIDGAYSDAQRLTQNLHIRLGNKLDIRTSGTAFAALRGGPRIQAIYEVVGPGYDDAGRLLAFRTKLVGLAVRQGHNTILTERDVESAFMIFLY